MRFEMLPVSATALLSIAGQIEQMSLEEKVGQVMMVHFHGREANEEARFLVQELHIGGICYFDWANGLESAERVAFLSEELQKLTHVPLLIAVDQEGGRVRRLKEGFVALPSAREMGQMGAEKTRESALEMGQQMLKAGVNVDFAPVVDVDSNPNNPIIGDRSYSRDPAGVIAMAGAAIDGYKEAGVLTTIKHFPGHGDTSVDSHLGLPVIDKSLEELEQVELAPFRTLAQKADLVMTGHLLAKAIDPENCATLSEKAISFLRRDLGFQGVVVTDSLVMAGVLRQAGSVAEAAMRALNAGADLLLLAGKAGGNELKPEEVQAVRDFLVRQVQIGRIEEGRLNEAVLRVLELKAKAEQNRKRQNDDQRVAK